MIRRLLDRLFYYRNFIYVYVLKRKFCFSGDLFQVKGIAVFYGRGRLELSQGARINSGYYLNPIGRHKRAVFSCSDGASIEIGEYTGISNSVFFCRSRIKVGNNCKIGGGVEIYDTDFHWLSSEARKSEQPNLPNGKTEAIEIGNDVFIGSNVTVLRGSKIPDGVIIGSGSVICRQCISPYEIWAGNPARKIGYTR